MGQSTWQIWSRLKAAQWPMSTISFQRWSKSMTHARLNIIFTKRSRMPHRNEPSKWADEIIKTRVKVHKMPLSLSIVAYPKWLCQRLVMRSFFRRARIYRRVTQALKILRGSRQSYLKQKKKRKKLESKFPKLRTHMVSWWTTQPCLS